MARKDSVLRDLFDIASRLPWWLGLAFAAGAYAGLHYYATPPTVEPAQMLPNVHRIVIAQLCFIGQYIIPAALVLGSLASFLAQLKRDRLYSGVQACAVNRNPLDTISWQEFEMLVGEFFRRKDFRVEECGGPVSDGGIDLRLRSKTDELYVVQCKHWKSMKVPVNVVRELFGVMTSVGAVGGYVVASGGFTSDAQAFARETNILLLDGPALVSEVQQRPIRLEPTLTPTCPVCHGMMIKRVAKRGANAGNAFWGCMNYPRCKGVISIHS